MEGDFITGKILVGHFYKILYEGNLEFIVQILEVKYDKVEAIVVTDKGVGAVYIDESRKNIVEYLGETYPRKSL